MGDHLGIPGARGFLPTRRGPLAPAARPDSWIPPAAPAPPGPRGAGGRGPDSHCRPGLPPRPGNTQKEWKSETGKGRSHLGGIKQGFCLGVTGTQSCWDPSKKQWETQLRVAPPKGEKPGVIINSRINVFHCLRFTRGV